MLRLWFAACRVTVRGDEAFREFAEHDTGIAAFWHYSFLYNMFYFGRYPAAVMVSASKDGEYIARLAQLMGHVPVRGSSNRGGVKALREMIDHLLHGKNSAIVADGSQGPARRAQAGVILMASKSGKPIFPVAWATNRSLHFNSWDRTLVPLPFSNIVIRHGEPLLVPPAVTPAQIETCRLELEQRLNRAYEAAWNEIGLPLHDLGAPQRHKHV
jgi:lysophospholipid acyltransferase (LPLAT)-like uncharacterized protein